jgi:hypothetical protein
MNFGISAESETEWTVAFTHCSSEAVKILGPRWETDAVPLLVEGRNHLNLTPHNNGEGYSERSPQSFRRFFLHLA